MDVLTPRTLDEALRLKAEHPDALADPGRHRRDGRAQLRPRRGRRRCSNLNEVAELRGWSRENGSLRLGAGLTYAEVDARRAARACCPRSPRRRARSARRRSATAARSAATSAPRRRPATRCRRSSSRARRSSARRCAARAACRSLEFVTGVKRNALAPDELITAVRLTPSSAPQTFMKVGPRNAMVIAVVSLAVSRRRRAARVVRLGVAAPGARDGAARRGRRRSPERVAAAASPIDDVRGTRALPAARAARADRRARSKRVLA